MLVLQDAGAWKMQRLSELPSAVHIGSNPQNDINEKQNVKAVWGRDMDTAAPYHILTAV